MPSYANVPDVELIDVFETDGGDLAEIGLFSAGKDISPVRLRVADEDGEAHAWMTADEAESFAHRLMGVAERARREGIQS